MDIESFRKYCLNKPGTEETMPFGPDTLVYKVMGKVFALTSLDEPEFRANLKCDPERAIELREEQPDRIVPGYHMNKKHWNTLYFERGIPNDLAIDLIDHSYQLVANSLPRKLKEELAKLNE